jgi:hypothetical protein
VIDATVNGSQVGATLTRISDGNPPEGTNITLNCSEDAQNVLTFTASSPPLDALGRLNLDGETYMVRDNDLTDSEGALQVGIRATSGATDTTLAGDYFVAMIHSDTSQSEGYFSGTYDMNFSSGTLTVTSLDSDQTPAIDYTVGTHTYSISSDGQLTVTVAASSQPLIGAARADGELFVLADTISGTDNSVKTIFVGIKKQSTASDASLAGTWDMGSLCSGFEGPSSQISWDESASSMVLDSAGSGTYTDESGTFPIDIDLNVNGTFPLSAFNSVGAVTASGDLMVVVNNRISSSSDYCLSVGVKQP